MSKAWMPIYWGDYLADTSNLTTLEHGAYLLLIAHYWQHGGIPNDDRQLHRITRCPNNQWKKVWANLQPYFSVQRNNSGSVELKQKRLELELEKAELIALKRKLNGAKGGWANRGKTNQERNYGKQLLRQRDDQSQSHSNLSSIAEAMRRRARGTFEEER